MMNNRRLPAEWEPVEAVILSWPHLDTDWQYMIDDVEQCYENLARALSKFCRVVIVGPDLDCAKLKLSDMDADKVIYFNVPTNDTWMRDYGPITTVNESGAFEYNDFKFNGWGLKFAADKDNVFTLSLCGCKLLKGERVNRLGFVLEGGSIESDGNGTLLTTSECLLSPNRNGDLSRDEIEQKLKDFFGIKSVLWLDHGALEGDDTDSHIDTLARLAPDNTIVYVGCDDKDDSHYEELCRMKENLLELHTLPTPEYPDGQPYNLVELPLPDPIYDEDGNRLPATYANYLTVNDAILLPIYNQPKKDKLAVQIMKIVYPEYEIVTVDCTALIKQHGSLHCATMQLPKNSLNF